MAIPNESVKQQVGSMSHEQLMQLINAIRTPVKTEKEINTELQLERDREAMAETLKTAERLKLHRQETCSHMRPNGSTTAVYIPDLNRLYCQACTKWIFPEKEGDLFNKLYQLAL